MPPSLPSDQGQSLDAEPLASKDAGEEATSIRPSGLGELLRRTTVELSDKAQRMSYEGRFITLTSPRHWCKIRSIGLKQEAIERDASDVFPQTAILESNHAIDADHHSLETEGLIQLRLAAREAMEDASHPMGHASHRGKGIGKGLPCVDDDGQIKVLSPSQLGLEGLNLLAAIGCVPVIVQTDLAYCDEGVLGKLLADEAELVLPILLDVGRMQPDGGKEVAGIQSRESHHRLVRSPIRGWHDDLRESRLLGSGHHLDEVAGKLLSIEVSMGVYDHCLAIAVHEGAEEILQLGPSGLVGYN